jgi:PBSX family phage terminase large subunit
MIFNDKIKAVVKQALDPSTRFLALEGVSQAGKSAAAILAFGLRVAESNNELHCIAAKDLDAIRDNMLTGKNKFLELFAGFARLVGGDIGSKYIEFHTPKGIKKILLAGYSDNATWKKILGKSIETFLIDEINIASQDFVRETMARQFSFDSPFTICTTNGTNPDHYIYTEYINYCDDLFPKQTPISTRQDMDAYQKKQGYYYAFWSFKDHPLMTEQKIQQIYDIYPPNSYYYQTKVLGVRGVQEGLLYAELITNQHIVDWDAIDKTAIKQLEIGIDIGDKAQTVFTLTGYTKGFSRAVVIDTVHFNEADYDEIIGRFNTWLDQWYQVFGNLIKGVWSDSADSIFIRTLRSRISMPIKVYSSKKLTIKERVILKEQLLHQHRLLFVRTYGAIDTANMLKRLKSDQKGGHLDEGKPEMDFNDSLDYSLTPHMKKLSDYAKE